MRRVAIAHSRPRRPKKGRGKGRRHWDTGTRDRRREKKGQTACGKTENPACGRTRRRRLDYKVDCKNPSRKVGERRRQAVAACREPSKRRRVVNPDGKGFLTLPVASCHNWSRLFARLSPWHNWIARRPPKPKVAGSNPAGDIFDACDKCCQGSTFCRASVNDVARCATARCPSSLQIAPCRCRDSRRVLRSHFLSRPLIRHAGRSVRFPSPNDARTCREYVP